MPAVPLEIIVTLAYLHNSREAQNPFGPVGGVTVFSFVKDSLC